MDLAGRVIAGRVGHKADVAYHIRAVACDAVDLEAALALYGDEEAAAAHFVDLGYARHGADCVGNGGRAGLFAGFDERYAEALVVFHAVFQHLLVALFEYLERQRGAGE